MGRMSLEPFTEILSEPGIVRYMVGEPARLLMVWATHVRVLSEPETSNSTPRHLSSPDPVLEWMIRSTPGIGSSREGRGGGGEGRGKHKEIGEQCRHHLHALPVSRSLFTFHHNSFRCNPCFWNNKRLLLCWTDSCGACIFPIILAAKWSECQVVLLFQFP